MSTLHLHPTLDQMSDSTLRDRVRARLLSARADDVLADGADPLSSPLLAARAEQLCSARSRAALAKGLTRAVADARRSRPSLTAAVHVARPAVRSCAPSLLALAAELGDAHVRLQGVALTRRLLSDGTSPLFCARAEDDLRAVVDEIRAAL
jgi:hypothetical protein